MKDLLVKDFRVKEKSTHTGLRPLLEYVLGKDKEKNRAHAESVLKTYGNIVGESDPLDDFNTIRDTYGNKKNKEYFHLLISVHPDDTDLFTADKMLEISKSFMEEFAPGYAYVVGVHGASTKVQRGEAHLHAHIVMCATHPDTGKIFTYPRDHMYECRDGLNQKLRGRYGVSPKAPGYHLDKARAAQLAVALEDPEMSARMTFAERRSVLAANHGIILTAPEEYLEIEEGKPILRFIVKPKDRKGPSGKTNAVVVEERFKRDPNDGFFEGRPHYLDRQGMDRDVVAAGTDQPSINGGIELAKAEPGDVYLWKYERHTVGEHWLLHFNKDGIWSSCRADMAGNGKLKKLFPSIHMETHHRYAKDRSWRQDIYDNLAGLDVMTIREHRDPDALLREKGYLMVPPAKVCLGERFPDKPEDFIFAKPKRPIPNLPAGDSVCIVPGTIEDYDLKLYTNDNKWSPMKLRYKMLPEGVSMADLRKVPFELDGHMVGFNPKTGALDLHDGTVVHLKMKVKDLNGAVLVDLRHPGHMVRVSSIRKVFHDERFLDYEGSGKLCRQRESRSNGKPLEVGDMDPFSRTAMRRPRTNREIEDDRTRKDAVRVQEKKKAERRREKERRNRQRAGRDDGGRSL